MDTCRASLFLLAVASSQFVKISEGAPLTHQEPGESADEVEFSLNLLLVVSLSMLVATVMLLLNCVTCCKQREINFKEFEDNFEDEIDFTPPAEDTPSMQSPAEVYTLAVPPAPLPGPPHLQLPRIAEVLTGPQVARHTLSYIQEIGSGWFGKVLLSESYSDPSVARVVVKELKANASSKEQNEFLQQGDPYRVLQHPNILQCLGQCVEAIPFLLVFEYCELGDLRSYVALQDWLYKTGELLQLQKMACEIAAGLTHLHKHNFLHSDLALRNCYLTTDLTVKIGDYGIGPSRFKEDYITTEEDQCIALRWLAPELVGELHGGVITSEQTKPSNVWALGVTLWELFERGKQPYTHLSDREVLHHVIRDQQIKLLKPQLDLPYSERWYELLQFCWLPADKRATAEEVHRLLTYLRMQGQKEIEDDFEQRWSSLKPNPMTRQATVRHSSFPILEQFDDGREPDEVLTVTETSRGLSFEYVWEAAKHDHYDSHNRSSMDTMVNYHSMFFPVPRQDIQSHFPEIGGEAVSQRVPGTLPVFDAREPNSGNEYYIQLEEQDESDIGVLDNQGSEGATASNKEQYVVLQDIRLDESSTDADFFHQSIDSKDSYLQDSHVWSSSDHESPYHTNIFNENDSKFEDSHSFRSGFMELPEMNLQISDSFHGDTNSVVQSEGLTTTFLEIEQEAANLRDVDEDNKDVMKLFNTEKLVDNFLFLKENSLMKDSFGLSESKDIQETDLSLISFDVNSSSRQNVSDDPSKSVVNSEHLRDEFLDLVNPILGDFLSPLKVSKTLVPSDTFSTEETCSNQPPEINGSSSEESARLASSKGWIHSTSESTSESPEVVNPSESHQLIVESAITDILCTDANTSSLEESLGVSKDNGQYIEIVECSEEKIKTSSPLSKSTEEVNGDQTEGLTNSESLSDMLTNGEKNRDIEDALLLEALNQEESLLDNCVSQDKSSLLISDSCLDQISQDSLLEDSISSALPTIENSAETPDSLDSLDMHREVGHVESLDTPVVHKLQAPYKTADSGYETENLESPEWNSQPSGNDVSQGKESSTTEEPPSTLAPPEIVVSEVESMPDVQDYGESHHQEIAEVVVGAHRDSAYFSDNEELDKRSDDPIPSSTGELLNQGAKSAEVSPLVSREGVHEKDTESVTSGKQEHFVSTAESAVADINVIKGTCLPELVLTSDMDCETEKPVTEDYSKKEERLEKFSDLLIDQTHSSAILEIQEATGSTSMQSSADIVVHAKLTRTYAGEGPKKKEPDMEGRYLGKLDEAAVAGGAEDGMEADEEDENSDDSDEDMRIYRPHSSGSESEDDVVHPVPVIVSDNSDACNLKSLLKAKSLQTAKSNAGGHVNANNRRAVSFFDDVTVYLFDQDTPTKELGDHLLGSNSQVSEFSSPVASSSYLNRFTNSESSTDEEGGAFEWDDDFSPEPSFLSKVGVDTANRAPVASQFFSPPPASHSSELSWSSPSTFSRFSISSANIASFSLTHLTDSDIEQGGSSEDGEKD
ncbi:serine/threonine-protein kinase LMTK2 isoform X2 [Electrophorus electricus]|uniref:serine/threonine-protein kinase LMTK2 isoform X2 n=1 Tax=Electrophorus electricus TaxID=8005 RepID=UPI0015D0A11E|nr:serine/threonine-protein kinase LMTK2 isoform X2 [Electrophorus electricus]